jgi:YqaJ-like viral recombinase domain
MASFNVIPLIQGTHEWKEWRKTGLGSSDISKIANPSSKSFISLLKEKLNYIDPNQSQDERSEEEKRAALKKIIDIKKAGDFGEKILNQIFFEKTGVKLEPICIESKKHPGFLYSSDGYSFEYGFFEWKMTTDESKFKRFRDGSFRANTLHPYLTQDYWLQLQWAMLVSGETSITLGMLHEQKETGKLEAFFRTFNKDAKLCKELEKQAKIFLSFLRNENIPSIGRIVREANLTVIPGEKNA